MDSTTAATLSRLIAEALALADAHGCLLLGIRLDQARLALAADLCLPAPRSDARENIFIG